MPLTHCVAGGQHVLETTPPPAIVPNPRQTCAVGQQTSSRHCIPGGQQNGSTPAAALPPQIDVDGQQAPLAHTVPGGQQMPPSQAWPIGQQMPPTASPTH